MKKYKAWFLNAIQVLMLSLTSRKEMSEGKEKFSLKVMR
jgi:hypothetical protein